MTRQRLLLTISAVVWATLWAYACGDGTTEPPPLPPDPPRPTTVTVSPATTELTALGATVQLSAEVRDQNGQVMAGTAVTWASSAAAVATVNASGLVTAVANGSATITATAGAASGSATATVAQVVSAVNVTPDTATVLEGDTLRLAATATDANGQVVAGVEFAWVSGDTAVATVDASGLMTGVGAGQAEVTATAAGVTGRAQLTVVAPMPTVVAVTPDRVVLTALGQTAQLAAEVRDQAGRVMNGVPVAWSSADTAVAVVDSSGLVSAEAVGTATITATAGEASGVAQVTVTQSVDSVAVSPSADTIAVGDTLRLVAEAHDEGGHVVAGAAFTWSSSNAGVATVDISGLVRGVREGEATITAAAGEASSDALVTVITATSPDRATLVAFYQATGGPSWRNNEGWLTDAPLGEWYGVATDASGRVTRLDLGGNWDVDNGLSGPIPPELGSLANLQSLYLNGNELTGPIPPELGNLADLYYLFLDRNGLTGRIPPELGSLANLYALDLAGNELTGPIPPELGSLANLYGLNLAANGLTGRIPAEMGGLIGLDWLYLGENELTGSLPPEFGELKRLRTLALQANVNMSGALPASLIGLAALETLQTGGTGLCAPSDAGFLEWLEGVENRRVALCEGESAAMAYLVQAVQSREFPVPLVAGEEALLRVFVTAGRENNESLPPVRASFYRNDALVHVADIPDKPGPIPTEVGEGSLAGSANAVIPARVVRPGLEMVIEVAPDGTLDAGLGVARRIPATGRIAVDVRDMPVFDLTVVPFLWTQDPDSAVLASVDGMAADPEGHELLELTRILLPVGDLKVTAHDPVLSSSNNGLDLFAETEAIRVLEAGTGYYLGMMSGRVTVGAFGVGAVAFAGPDARVIAHEIGHTFGLGHAPCGVNIVLDPAYPNTDGTTGAWGYDFREGSLVPPSWSELMSYCVPLWISDYNFTKALHHRLATESSGEASLVAGAAPSLLLWGSADSAGTLSLKPAFIVDVPVALPDSAGQHRITGRTATGATLFSLSFTMPETADGDGSSSFAFALPVRPGWEGSLASITLTGPGGTVTLDGDSDIPMTILRDPRTGQVRAILRDLPLQAEVAADGVGASARGLEVLFSRGIPDSTAWKR